MSITDAENPRDWQIGFEDGIKFAMHLRIAQELIVKPNPEWKWAKLEKPDLNRSVFLKFEKEEFTGFRGENYYFSNTVSDNRMLNAEYAENNGLMWKEIQD